MADEQKNLVDVESLSRFLRDQIPGATAPLVVAKHEAGYSNETFYVACGRQQWVLRRPPRGELLPTAHDVLREFRVLCALAGSVARAPRAVLACEDPRVIGAPFYLMERVEGVVVQEALPPYLDTDIERRRIGDELIDALVELHSVDWRATPLAEMGRPEGFVERQIRRWSSQIDLTLPQTRELPGIADVTGWLRTHMPASGTPAVVHGDYKLDNVILSPGPPAHLLALLDWEMATIGDPLTDLGWCLAHWGPTGDPVDELPEGINRVTTRHHFPPREALLARYEERSGRQVHDFQFYLCFAVWKLAIICEGLYQLHLRGTAPNPRTGDMEWRVPQLIRRLKRIIDGDL